MKRHKKKINSCEPHDGDLYYREEYCTNQPSLPWNCLRLSQCVWMCKCVCVRRTTAKLEPHSRWTVWINKCARHHCSLSPLPLLRVHPWLQQGRVMSWLLAFRGLLSDLAAEQIQSCLKVKKLKSPKLPLQFCPSQSVWWREWGGSRKVEGGVGVVGWKAFQTRGNQPGSKQCLVFLEKHANTLGAGLAPRRWTR